MLNYFGQGALVLSDQHNAMQPFFLLAPSWFLFPLVVIATSAAVIASQALISGAFSLTRQAILLGYAPRLDIAHTSHHEMGQVYVPQVNWGLMFCTIAIVLGFQTSTALAATYGIAVTITMVITAMLLHVVMTERWKWPPLVAAAITTTFLVIDVDADGRQPAQGDARRLAAAGRRGAGLHADDHVEDRPPAGGGTADGARHPGSGLHGQRGGDEADARHRHGGVHDGAAAGHAAGAGAQPALQQDPARARGHPDRQHDPQPVRELRGPGDGREPRARASTT